MQEKPTGAQFTDVMVAVADLEATVRFWTTTMGLTRSELGAGWVLLCDESTGQRLVVTDRPMGSPWALSLGAADLDGELKRLAAHGVTLVGMHRLEDGFEYAQCTDPSGLPLLIYKA